MRKIKFRAWFITHKKMYSAYDFMNMSGFVDFLKNETVIPMQFTGLLDKNGKEIYEGDIVRWMSHRGRKEIFIEAKVAWGICGFWTQGWLDKLDMNYRNMEVIGNIYENPEILNGHEGLPTKGSG